MTSANEPAYDTPTALAEACASWQGGRDIGSSLLRGAARVLSGERHYFSSDYIAGYEESARINPVALGHARTLLGAINASEPRTAGEWCSELNLRATGFAGRGLERKPNEDDQIAGHLEAGHITMPLWGVSLDSSIARSFGSNDLRWIFQIVGAFPAVPAWSHSGIKEEEQELICGGKYRVVDQSPDCDATTVTLSYEGPIAFPNEL
jgi:hypothetical protein